LQKLIADFGKFNDAFEGNLPKQGKEYAQVLLDGTTDGKLKKLDKEVGKFDAASHKSMRKYVDGTLEGLREKVAQPELPVHEFHEVRKELKVFLNMFNLERSQRPTPELDQAYKHLYELNEKLGGIHDDLTYKSARGEIDYDTHMVKVPRELRETVEQLSAA